MSLQTPTTKDISDAIVAQMQSSLGQTIPILPKAFVRVLASVLAGVFMLLWKYAGFVFLQMFVRWATMEETEINGTTVRPLVEWGRLIGIGDPTAATQAEHVVEVTVLNQTGSLAALTQLVRGETGVTYQTVAAVTLNAATVQVTVRAASDQEGGDGSGEIGNLVVGDTLSFANPQANVSREVTVLSQTVTGADEEEAEAYRQRIFRRFQRKPQGGAYADYQLWAEEVAGVAHAYPYTGDPGEVDVYVEVTTDIDPDGIPTAAILTAVSDAIQLEVSGLATNRPVTAAVNCLPITRTTFDVVVTGLFVDDEAGCIAAIEESADEYLRSREPFIVGLSVLPREDRATGAAIGGIVDSVVAAFGGTVNDVQIERNGDTVVAHTLDHGEKLKLGVVSYN
jgi:uncharacterized phage protein gp47/JayE